MKEGLVRERSYGEGITKEQALKRIQDVQEGLDFLGDNAGGAVVPERCLYFSLGLEDVVRFIRGLPDDVVKSLDFSRE